VSDDPENKLVWILGLNHSGTTIVWRAFRKDQRFLCFDEPLTGDLGTWFPRNNPKRTFDEYLRLFGAEPKRFWDLYEPIDPLQELDPSLTAEQERYLRSLIDGSPNVVIDETHLHLHLASLVELARHGRVVHLHRRASAFVTSHLRPTWSRKTTWFRRLVLRVRDEFNKRTFWTRRELLPGLRRGNVIGRSPSSKFGLMLAEAGYDAERIMAKPAIVRLLAYWHYHYHYLEREGPRLLGQRFRSLRYEEFASRPRETMADLYGWIGLERPQELEYSDVHPPKPPFRKGDRRWSNAARHAGFGDAEIETLL